MNRRRSFRALHQQLEAHSSDSESAVFTDAADDTDRASSLPPSSPSTHLNYFSISTTSVSTPGPPIPFLSQEIPIEDDRHDATYRVEPTVPMTDEDRTVEMIGKLKTLGDRFSLRTFLLTLFKSNDPRITQSVNLFIARDGVKDLLETWDEKLQGDRRRSLDDWAIQRTATICSRNAAHLTNLASDGPFKAEAEYLRMPDTKATASRFREFSYAKLCKIYDKTMEPLQKILNSVIGKEKGSVGTSDRSPDHVRTYVTSILLNMRSRETNIHQSVLSVIAWNLGVQRRYIEEMNHLAATVSYPKTISLIKNIGRDVVTHARIDANNPALAKLTEYDNYNWMKVVHEAVLGHASIQYDQVSGILIIMWLPPGVTAAEATSIAAFDAQRGKRHEIDPSESLEDILPSPEDEQEFRKNLILHVSAVLCENVPSLADLSSPIASRFTDPKSIAPHVTRQHYLPTLDQEQGTVKGNMEVLETYLFNTLKMPKEAFEKRITAVLGDRLTTARDRAAQTQRAIDRSESRGEKFSSIVLLPGLMHTRLALLELVNRQFWHQGNETRDPTDLGLLKKLLPHRTHVKHGKIDFYAWLRFLNVAFAGLVLAAANAIEQTDSLEALRARLGTSIKGQKGLQKLASAIVDRFLGPTINRLEAEGIKTLKGDSRTGHAIILFQLLALLRETTHSIKHGHPTRIVQTLKYAYPIFYAGGSYNYSAEIGEFLHNITHDWPSQSVDMLTCALLVNTTGRPDGFAETDLNGEHYNRDIKGLTHGPNMTPHLLSQITPALGVLREVTDNTFTELGVEDMYTRHSGVKATADIELLSKHFIANAVFDFGSDERSEYHIQDLYIKGRQLLAGGGHQKQLERHRATLRTRELSADDTAIPADEEAQHFDSVAREFDLGDENEVWEGGREEVVAGSQQDSDADGEEMTDSD